MPRPLRIECPCGWYLVYNSSRNSQPLFWSDDDYVLFLAKLEKCVSRYGIEVHSYALLPNCYYLLISTPNSNLSKSMRYVNGKYAQAICRKRELDCGIFHGRYRYVLFEESEFLMELVRYIHRKPYRMKLESRPGEYQWCSHRGYVNEHDYPVFLKVKTVLAKFAEDERAARRKLDAYVNKDRSSGLEQRLENEKWPEILGGESLYESVRCFFKTSKRNIEKYPRYRKYTRTISISDIASRVLADQSLTMEEINHTRDQHCLNVRRALIFLLRKSFYGSLREVSAALGNISTSLVSAQFYQAQDEIKGRNGCYKTLRIIRKLLRK